MNYLKVIFILGLLKSITFKATGQIECSYLPLEFQNMYPKWRHISVDSSIIGYSDPDSTIVYHYNGHDHLSWDIGSFVDGDYLYSISEIDISGDIAGAMVEKIDLLTGNLLWQISTDLRESRFREKVLSTTIKNNMFVIQGIREDVANEFSNDEQFFVGKKNGVIYKRSYDLDTGELIDYDTPNEEDSLAYKLSFTPWVYYNYFGDDGVDNFLDARNYVTGYGSYLIRQKVNYQGKILTNRDTIVKSRFSDRSLFDAVDVSGPRFTKRENGNYLYIEQFSPRENSNYSFEAIITEYDDEFNVVQERDLKDFGLTEFSNIQIIKSLDNHILIRGCYNYDSSILVTCIGFCLVLDNNFNLVTKFDLSDTNGTEYLFNPNKIIKSKNGKYVFPFIDFTSDNYSTIKFLQSNDSGLVELIKEWSIDRDNWITSIDFMTILDDGDLLIKFRHGCFEDGIRVGEFREWQRIRNSDLSTIFDKSSNVEINITPNPFNDHIQINKHDNSIMKVEIYDLHGKLAKNIDYFSTSYIDMSHVDKGFYLVIISDKFNNISTSKIVKF